MSKEEDELIFSFKEKLQEANFFLLNKRELSFMGCNSYGMDVRIIKSKDGKNLDGVVPASFSDGKSITYVINDDMSESDIIFSTIHSLLHTMLCHYNRKNDRDEKIWVAATDHVVNKICMEMSKNGYIFKIPKDIIYFEDIAKSHPDASAEEVYEMLMKKNNQKSNQSSNGNTGASGQSAVNKFLSEEAGDPSDGGLQIIIVVYNGKKMKAVNDVNPDKNPNNSQNPSNKLVRGMNGRQLDVSNFMDSTSMEYSMREFTNESKMRWNSELVDKGNLPGSFKTMLDELYKIEVPWQQLLENAILFLVQAVGNRTWTSVDLYLRRFCRAPGRKNKNHGKKSLYVGIDTSGSVGDDDLKKFIGCLVGTAKLFKSMKVFFHDYIVQNVVDISKLTENEIYTLIKEVKGRGGTSHKDLFDKIQETIDDDDVTSVVFLTDYESDVQHIYNDYDFMKQYETIWVLNRNYKVELAGCDTKYIQIK